MKIALWMFAKPSDTATMSTHRSASFASRELGVPIHWDQDIVKERPDVLVIFSGGMAFCNHLASVAKVIEYVPKIVWACNDYRSRAPSADSKAKSPFRRAFARRRRKGLPHVDYWTTVQEHAKSTPGGRVVDWNKVVYDPQPLPKTRSPSTLIYYGSYRENRLETLDYFLSTPKVTTIVSNASGRFEERYPRCEHFGSLPQPLSNSLRGFGAGLYVNDESVAAGGWHEPPANRFYEMLSAGLPMLVHPGSLETLRGAGIDASDYVVRDAAEVERMMRVRTKIKFAQYEWRRDFIEEVRQDLRNAVRAL